MKKEKDIVKFFDRYSEQMLPEDGEQFMKKLKQNMDLLPVPSAFNKMDPELSKEYAEWLLIKLKKDYKRAKIDAIMSCVFTSIIIAALFLVINALGLLENNIILSLCVFVAVGIVAIGFTFSVIPSQLKKS